MLSPMAAEPGGGASGRRWWFVVLAGVVAVAAVVGVTAFVTTESPSAAPRDREAEAAATAATWLRAWERDDRRALRALVAGHSDALDDTLDEVTDLRPTSIRAAAGVPTVTGGSASVPFDVEITLSALGVWRYAGTVTLVDTDVKVGGDREREWRVAFTPSVVHPDLQPGDGLKLKLAWTKRGVLQADDGTPLPAGHALGTVLGTVGRASAADVKALGPPYRTGDLVGQSGLQESFEKELAGTPAADLQLVRGGKVVRSEVSFAPTPGRSVRTTINLAAQSAAEAALGNEGNGAAMVVMRPSTGGIIAVANRPQNGYSRALVGRYPPGSTFKVVTTLALLQKGVTLDTRVSCPKEITVNGRTIANAEEEELGDIDLRDAFAHSCNTAFIQLAQRLTPDELVAAADALGFNTKPATGVDLPASEFPKPRGAVDLVSSAIGQGRSLVTPLQMASVAASVASGSYRRPHFVDQLDNTGGTPLPAGTAVTLQSLMRRVVTVGTGMKANVPGAPVSGKTGTAEFGTVAPLHTHAWFISYRGDVASSVLVEDSGFGGDFAAPIAADFYRRLG
jgi:hypothetical protein